ncbi:MAG TPA: hypothetical protein VN429_04545 [Methanospirillum sp.]|uniref:hypothetical protein n=1 Tax=Methanospirillum sp. TaxID=45200 RepID=UPI002C64AC26|nr:hypothetical protein [Methanospirillum sp.]HWQ63665.1 hypothetical protein [Methanospirillum sp.]
MMYQYHKCQTRRTVEYVARNILLREGYAVLRVTERQGGIPSLFHLIAWREDLGILFVRTGSTRMSVHSFNKQVERLSLYVRTCWYPGDVQFWIAKGGEWDKYQILPGGAIPILEEKSE